MSHQRYPSWSCLAVAVLALTLSVQAVARSAPGDIDPVFGLDGKFTLNLGGPSDTTSSATMQPDGKILVLARSFVYESPQGHKTVLLRLQPNGALDPSFGQAGQAIHWLANGTFMAAAIVLQADGKILVAGRAVSPRSTQDFALARFQPDGSLDTAFGEGGIVYTNVGGSAGVNAMIQDSEGRIIIAGSGSRAYFWSASDFALARYNADGTPDLTFGQSGTVITDFSTKGDIAEALVIQPDGAIIAAGSTMSTSASELDIGLVRYKPDGSLDTSFGTGGKVVTDFPGGGWYHPYNAAAAVALQPDGKVLIAGYAARDFSSYDIALARYLPNGELDTTFGDAGRVATDIHYAFDSGSSILVEPGGKIVVAGSGTRAWSEFVIARYDSEGNPDLTFGEGGVSTLDFNDYNDYAGTLLRQDDGKYILAGVTYVRKYILIEGVKYYLGDPPETDIALARVLNPESVAVGVDIRPGAYPNTVNLGSGGTVAVAILGSAEFDARQVDPQTVTLASAATALKGKSSLMASVDDVNGDGYDDFVVHVETEALQLAESDADALMEGRTTDGLPFRGNDTVRVLP